MTALEVLRSYLLERARRESPPSLAGIEPDTPRGTAPPSGRWEMLLGLVRGVPAEGIEVCDLLLIGYHRGGQWQVSRLELESGREILTQEQVARPVDRRAAARKLSISRAELTRRYNEALTVVGGNLERARDLERLYGRR